MNHYDDISITLLNENTVLVKDRKEPTIDSINYMFDQIDQLTINLPIFYINPLCI